MKIKKLKEDYFSLEQRKMFLNTLKAINEVPGAPYREVKILQGWLEDNGVFVISLITTKGFKWQRSQEAEIG